MRTPFPPIWATPRAECESSEVSLHTSVCFRMVARQMRHFCRRMQTEAHVPRNSTPRKVRWQRIARVGGRSLRRRRAFLAAVVLPPVSLLLVAGLVYHHYAAVIDKRLRHGPFEDAANIYGAPFVLTAGDVLSLNDLEAELRLAGFNESSSGQPGTWRLSSGTLEIFPARGSSGGTARIAFSASSAVGNISVDGHPVQSWTLGYPLMANLTAARDKRRLVTFGEIPRVLVNAVVSAEDKHFFQHSG